MKQSQQVRQGDVFLERVSSLPAKAVRLSRDQGRLILAYGEQTGHAHVVETDADVVEAFLAELDGQTYLSVPASARVVHEEHGTIPLPKGVYKVVRQREYNPEAIRNVRD
jgi:hypothetical protein